MKNTNTYAKCRRPGLAGHLQAHGHHYFLGVVAIALIVTTFTLLPKLDKGHFVTVKAQITNNGAPAIDVLGQTIGGLPTFTKGGTNDSPQRDSMTPSGSVVDSVHHRLFIADYAGSRVLVYNLDNTNQLLDHIPDFVLGTTDFGTGGRTMQNSFTYPMGLAYDQVHNRLFVADSADNRVMVFDVATITNGEDAVNVLGQPDFNSTVAATTQKGMRNPSGLAYDEIKDRLYVAERGSNRILVFDVTTIVNGEDAIDVFGQTSYTKSGIYGGKIAPNNALIMKLPEDVVFDAVHHRLFVVDFFNNRVLVYKLNEETNLLEDQIPDYVLGQTNFENVAPATTDKGMNGPWGLAYDSTSNRLFVVDCINNRVLVFNVSTITNGQAATQVLGQSNFTSNIAGLGNDKMNSPGRLAYDSVNNRLFVTDDYNNRILVFSTVTITNGQPAIYVIGQPDFDSNTVLNCNAAQFSYAGSLAYDEDNSRLFVGDEYYYRVLSFDVAPSIITNGEDASYVLGQTGLTSCAGYGWSQTKMYVPEGLAYDRVNSRLFVSDTYNNRVLSFNVATSTMANGLPASNVLGQPDFTSHFAGLSQSRLGNPEGLAYDQGNDRLYVADGGNNRVVSFAVAPSVITNGENANGLLGQKDYDTNWANMRIGFPNNTGFYYPVGVAIDTVHNRLFTIENCGDRVMVFNLDDNTPYEADFVLGQPNFTTVTMQITQSGLLAPQGGLTYDANNDRLFVGDGLRTLVFNVAPSFITNGENASHVLGQPNFTSNIGSATQATTWGPYGLAYDPINNSLYVSDYTYNRTMVFDAAPSTITNGENAKDLLGRGMEDPITGIFTPNYTDIRAVNVTKRQGMWGPKATAVDTTHHRLFVTDFYNNRVLVYNLDANNQLEDRLPDFVLGQPDFESKGTASMYMPWGLAYDSVQNRLFVSERYRSRVLIFDVTTITNGEAQVGQIGPLLGVFSGPTALAYDQTNNRLFVADQNNNRVLIFDVTSDSSDDYAINVLGQNDFTDTRNHGSTQASVNYPAGLAYDAEDNYLFVSEPGGNRVKVFDVAPSTITNGENAINVLGQPDFTSSGNVPVTQSSLYWPQGLAYDAVSKSLFVADNSNSRVMIFDVTSISNGENAISVLGQPDFTSSAHTTTQTGLSYPEDLGYDPTTGHLYVADSGNNRVMIFAMELYKQGINVFVRGATVGANGAAPGQSPLSGATAKAFLTSDACASSYAGDFDGMNATCKPAATCTTIANGTCTLKMAPGMYRILVTSDQFLGQISKDANVVQIKPEEFQKKNYIFVKTIDGKIVGGTSRQVTGSELWIYEPTAVLWDSTQAYYPFVFESDSDWTVNVCLNPPEGYQVDHGSQDCIQTGVANESKTIIFKMVEVGSVPSPANVTFNVKHAGKSQVVKSKIEARLSPGLAQKKGLKIDKFGRVGK